MPSDIRWIAPQYDFPLNLAHISVPGNARVPLQHMADELVGTQGLVAIYIPEGVEDAWQPAGKRGRVIGAVRLVEMPAGRRMENYPCHDWDGKLRWPIGWPCEIVYAPGEAESPSLREHVEHLFGQGSFQGYVSKFQLGPFPLQTKMRERLNHDFDKFARLR